MRELSRGGRRSNSTLRNGKDFPAALSTHRVKDVITVYFNNSFTWQCVCVCVYSTLNQVLFKGEVVVLIACLWLGVHVHLSELYIYVMI